MAESILKIGQLESTIPFDLPNAKVTEALELLLDDNFDGAGLTAKQRLDAAHRAMLEGVMREVERAALRREEATAELDVRKQRQERRDRARAASQLLKRKEPEITPPFKPSN